MKFLLIILIVTVIFLGCKDKQPQNIKYKWEAYTQVYEDKGEAIILPPSPKNIKYRRRVIIKKEVVSYQVYFNLGIKIFNNSNDTIKYPFVNICNFYHQVSDQKTQIIFNKNQLYTMPPGDSVLPIFLCKTPIFLTKEFKYAEKKLTIDEYLNKKQKIQESIKSKCDSLVKKSKIFLIKCNDNNSQVELTFSPAQLSVVK